MAPITIMVIMLAVLSTFVAAEDCSMADTGLPGGGISSYKPASFQVIYIFRYDST